MSDRALKRLVGELAACSDEDVEAVLGQLGQPERARARALLARHAGVTLGGAPAATGLSSWLAERLDGDAATALGMTAAAREALRAAATETGAVPERRSPSLLGQLLARGGAGR
ncbi:MAG: hypothetical protein E6G94_15010 [Alphaproteobacteria bacterium]|nr:MAG: hypothetical protein E6G94_15010 [Alphaproteobacteria bacterium]